MRLLAATAVLALCAISLAQAPAAPAQAAEASIKLLDFYVYPEDSGQMSKAEGYAWPKVRQLSALVHVELEGFAGERELELFFAAKRPDGTVINKIKQKHPLAAGEHELVVPDFIATEDYYGRHSFHADLELNMKGAGLVRGSTQFELTGPDPPEVDISRVRVFNPVGGYRDRYFEPGDTFAVEANITIGDNPSGARPVITIYGVMDEDVYETAPDGNYEIYYEQWESGEAQFSSGQFRLRAFGWLPRFFAEPWDYWHPFKIYVLVSFGPGADTADFAAESLYDQVGGDVRQTEDIEDRLIEISPSYNWDFRRGRAPFDDPDRF